MPCIFQEVTREINSDPVFMKIHGRILDLLEISNPAAFSVLLYNLGAFTCPSRDQVVVGFTATFTIEVTIFLFRSEEQITVGQLYVAGANAVGGLRLWSTNINKKICKEDCLVAIAYLRDTKVAVAHLQGYDATVDKATMARKTVNLIEEDHRVLGTMQSGVVVPLEDAQAPLGPYCRVLSGLQINSGIEIEGGRRLVLRGVFSRLAASFR